MRENNFVEAMKSLRENNDRLAEAREKSLQEAAERKQKFVNEYHDIRASREIKQRRHGMLMEECRNDALATALKAIYITALEAHTLTDDGILLAESMVDNWIKEKGGASVILRECKNKTYLLSRISEIVEEAAIIETEEIEKIENDEIEIDEPADEAPVEDSQNTEVELATKVIEKNLDTSDEEVKKALEVIKAKAAEADTTEPEEAPVAEEEPSDKPEIKDEAEEPADAEEEPADSEEPKNDEESKDEEPVDAEEPKNDDEVEEPADDTEEEPADSEEPEEDPLNDTFDDVDDDESEEESEDEEIPDDATDDSDDNESDVADDIVDDLEEVPDEDLTVDGDSENNGKVFDELEKEEDVQKAVELIRQRVADAEETFIKRNAEDKKQVEELIGRISDNVKTVEDISDKEDGKSKVAEESARLCKQKMTSITENRPLSVFEKMTRNLYSNIIKDQAIKEHYSSEEGMDQGMIVESSKVMYGFLETLNTLQLEKVDAKYIKEVLESM